MTSYFEIAGEIVELLDIVQSPELREFASDAVLPVLGLVAESVLVYQASKTERIEEKDSLGEHWLKMVTMPVRSIIPTLGLDLLTGRAMNPVLLAARGVAVYTRQVQYNYDYFVKGESHDW